MYCCCSELISCSHHLSIQSAIVSSSSPIKFSDSCTDHSATQPSDVAVDIDAVATEPMCAFHSGDVVDGEDCESVSECVACDEREQLALLDSPPLTVLTGG